MKLRGIDFGNVLGASGVQGFFGEGYWFHKPWKLIGMDLKRMTFVSKTATYLPQKGNMALTKDYKPKYPFPRCVRVKFFRGNALNAVGLSNPSLGLLLATGSWQKFTDPFWISLMSLAGTSEKRLDEFRRMCELIGLALPSFSASVGLQINLSCPNTGHDPSELIKESTQVLDIFHTLKVPVMPKYSIASASIDAIMELQDHPGCDAICVSNTIPFGWDGIGWNSAWGTTTSPLSYLGGGGLSGNALCPLVCVWIDHLRSAGFTKPINGGGGIFSPSHVKQYHNAGASSIFLGSVGILRPWRVKSIIDQAESMEWS